MIKTVFLVIFTIIIGVVAVGSAFMRKGKDWYNTNPDDYEKEE